MFEETIKSVLMGAAAGFTSVMIGYFRKTPVPQFSGKKFIKTLIYFLSSLKCLSNISNISLSDSFTTS